MTAKQQPSGTEGVRTLLIERITKRTVKAKAPTETVEMDVPVNAKVTFGPLFPGKVYNGDNEGYFLRVYVGTQQNQIAVLDGVRSFRDKELPYREPLPEPEDEKPTGPTVLRTLDDLPPPKLREGF